MGFDLNKSKKLEFLLIFSFQKNKGTKFVSGATFKNIC